VSSRRYLPEISMSRALMVSLVLGSAALLGACGGDDGGGGAGLAVAKTASNSGNSQTGPVNTALPQPLRVIVTNNGVAQAGTAVTWSTSNGGVNPPSSTTGADGIATTVWTLGSTSGAQAAQAAVAGATGSPVAFAATGTAVGGATTVNVSDNAFSPGVVTIVAGGAVRFLWASGAMNHNVTPATGNPSVLPRSPGLPLLLDAPQDFTVSFPAAGVFRFYCSAHGAEDTPTTVSGMSGTVTVN
jgi:plastocyanin